MRCPKCGYNSFDHLDSCKKCGKDLVEFKQNFGIKSVLFPGQMDSDGGDKESELDSATADVAVAVATGATAAAATDAAMSDLNVESAMTEPDGDDFGFDFMGDGAEDDDLSFDELFEEAPEDEDVEETIEGPKGAQDEEAAGSGEDFSFDSPGDEIELESDFGFDPKEETGASVTEDSFSFDDPDQDDPASEPEDSGSEEDPQRPFDLPESPQFVGAPEDRQNIPEEQQSSFVATEKTVDLFSAEDDSAAASIPDELPESHAFESEAVAVSAPVPAEQSDSVVATNQPVVEASVPPAEVIASVAAPVIQDDQSAEVIASAAISPPLLFSCVKAFICDLILLAVVGISFIVAAEAAMATGELGLFPSLETLINLSVPYFLVLFFLAFGYFTLFHFLVGQTPGKMLTGLRVETTEGEPLTFAQAFLRSVGGLFQLLPVGLGYLLVLSNSERRGWNDRLAGTRVVNLRNLPGEN
ncbi:MAG: hypothetical protein DRH06_07425 [Deltaproteobacteria bacterium]|nr:MAG: hypothetical protein DRH06_07425 [Deltaproteobacteria bacterium]